MILKGSQRGGAANLASHLMNIHDNDHVTLHELRGFVADDLHGALDEAHAISKATKCQQFLFSLSLNPPQSEYADIDALEDAADRAEAALGLDGQPRAIVIHEKEGRRHAHVVWSRIAPSEMKAINLSFFKNRLAALSKELYLEHGWELPEGHKTNGWKNPLNFSLSEWQQAQRLDLDPREVKQIFRTAFTQSDGVKAFAAALERSGYYLAKGDRRGFVAIDIHGEIFSIARWAGIKTKQVKAKLGDPEHLPSVDEIKTQIRQRLTSHMKDRFREAQEAQKTEMQPIVDERAKLITAHREEREHLQFRQKMRWDRETRERSKRLRTGLKRIWDHLTGKAVAIKRRNERDAYRSHLRDKRQRERLFIAQMKERRVFQKQLIALRDKHKQQRQILRRHIAEILSRHDSLKSRSGQSMKNRSRSHSPSPGR